MVYRKEVEQEIQNLHRQLMQQQDDRQRLEEEWKKKFEDQQIEDELKLRESMNQMTNKYEIQLKQTKDEFERDMRNLEKEKQETITLIQIDMEQLKLEKDKITRQLESDNLEWETKYNDMQNKLNLRYKEQEELYD